MLCNEVANYGLFNFLEFLPKSDEIKIKKCNYINNNFFEILNTNATNIQKEV